MGRRLCTLRRMVMTLFWFERVDKTHISIRLFRLCANRGCYARRYRTFIRGARPCGYLLSPRVHLSVGLPGYARTSAALPKHSTCTDHTCPSSLKPVGDEASSLRCQVRNRLLALTIAASVHSNARLSLVASTSNITDLLGA